MIIGWTMICCDNRTKRFFTLQRRLALSIFSLVCSTRFGIPPLFGVRALCKRRWELSNTKIYWGHRMPEKVLSFFLNAGVILSSITKRQQTKRKNYYPFRDSCIQKKSRNIRFQKLEPYRTQFFFLPYTIHNIDWIFMISCLGIYGITSFYVYKPFVFFFYIYIMRSE